MQNLAGVLGAAGKIGSGFGFFNSGGRVAFKSQGGLSGMVKQMSDGMTVGSEENATTNSVNKELLGTLLSLQTGLTDYNTAMEEALDARKKLAEEKKEQLKKQTSPINYISDLLVGYAGAEPGTGFGVQAASAAEYASGQREAIQDELNQIEEDLASGKLTQAEASLKMKQLQAESLSDIKDALGGADIESADLNALSRIAATRTGATYDETTGIVTGSAAEKKAQVTLLRDMAKAFSSGGYDDALAIAQSYGGATAVDPSTSVTSSVPPEDDPAAGIAGDVIQGLPD